MHEINNPLATILACCEALALRTADLAPPDRHGYDEYLKIIDTEVQRCRRIVESLLDFSRPKGGDKKPTDVNGVVDRDRKSTRLNSSHSQISYAAFCLKKKNTYK